MLDWVEIVLFIIYFLLDVKDGVTKWRYRKPKEKETWQSKIRREKYSSSDYFKKRKRW